MATTAGLSHLGMASAATVMGSSYRQSNVVSLADSDTTWDNTRDSIAVDSCGTAAKV